MIPRVPLAPALVACALFVAMDSTFAQQPAPFGHGDPAQGHALADKDCQSCHVRMFGDADRIYLREERRVRNAAQLRAQVAFCNTQLATGYFPEEEDHIAAWLNERYYRFEP